jgi:predicted choloylglycine hydrolase
MNVFELDGSNYQMGMEQGQHFSEQIETLYEQLTHSEEFLATKPFLLPKFLFFKLASIFTSKMIEDPIKEHLPSQWDFLLGLKEGTGLSIKKILFLQAIDALGTQIENYDVKENADFSFNNCSAVGVKSERSSTDGVLMIKNWDGPNFLAEHIIFRRIKPSNGKYSTLGSGVDGLVGINNGINEKGLSMVYNYAYPLDIGKEGIPPMFLIRAVLEECKTVEEAIGVLERYPRLGGANYMIGDKQGDLVVIESDPSKLEVRREGSHGEKEYMICTNHYITHGMQLKEIPRNAIYNEEAAEYLRGKPVHKSSILRYKNASEILQETAPSKITLDFLNKEIQCSHGPENNPSENTFCNHGKGISTGFGIMIDIQNEHFYAMYGNPCRGKMCNLSEF